MKDCFLFLAVLFFVVLVDIYGECFPTIIWYICRRSLITPMFLGMLFFIAVAIGMVPEPRHLGNGSTYFCGAEGLSLSLCVCVTLARVFKDTWWCEISFITSICDKKTISKRAFLFFFCGLILALHWDDLYDKRVWISYFGLNPQFLIASIKALIFLKK